MVTKERSPSFPFVSLKVALGRLSALEQKFGRYPVPADKAGLAWGMKEGSSQAHQMLAALKSYGLVAYEGASKDRKAVITDDARTYLRAQQDHIKEEVIRKAALKPKLFNLFWGIWGAQQIPNEVRLDELVLKHSFTDSAAQTFLRVYDETLQFAQLTQSENLHISTVLGDDDAADEQKVHQDEDQGATESVARPTLAKSLPVANSSVKHSDEWTEEKLIDDSGHEIRILYHGNASLQRYEYIRDYLDFKILRLRKQIN